VPLLLMACESESWKNGIGNQSHAQIAPHTAFELQWGWRRYPSDMLAVHVFSDGRVETVRTSVEDALDGSVQILLESKVFTLLPKEMSRLTALANETGALKLRETYRDKRRHDGEQTILSVKHGGLAYEVFCDNYLPSEVDAFSSGLEKLLGGHLSRGSWQRLPLEQLDIVIRQYWRERGWSGS
jgi:hypothetical protein